MKPGSRRPHVSGTPHYLCRRRVDPMAITVENERASASVNGDDLLPEGWSTARVGEYFDAWGGATPSTGERRYWGGTIPWISSKDVKQPRLRTGTSFITEAALHETRLRICPSGSVLGDIVKCCGLAK